MHEKWKGAHVSPLIKDLSKDFYTINHGLMLAKLKAYGHSTKVLNLMLSYLKNSKQKVQINNKFSSVRNVIEMLFHNDLLTDRFSSLCLLMNLCFYSI